MPHAGPEGPSESDLLVALARRVRRLRAERGWTRQGLAQRSGLSVRFLARIESGEGNISVRRLEALALALGTTPDELIRRPPHRTGVIALVGLRGAGKSTVGPLLAERMAIPFIEMDDLIVETAGLSLDELFELHGEAYYRRLERETLGQVLRGGRPAVLAAAGGAVNDPATWDLLCERTTVVWLQARPEDHWQRVVAQGDRRPMEGNPAAMQELRALLDSRRPAYSRARWIQDTTGIDPDEVARRVAGVLGDPTSRSAEG